MAAPKFYAYHEITRELVGWGYADPSPMEPGVYIFPPCTTQDLPPAYSIHEKPRWLSVDGLPEAWHIAIDRRGETWWQADGTAVVVSEFGNPADMGLTDEEPFIEPNPLEQPDPANVALAVDREADIRIQSGVVFNGILFDYDYAKAKTRISGIATLAGFAVLAGNGDKLDWQEEGEPFTFYAKDNRHIPLTAAEMFAFGRTAAAWEGAHVRAARTLKDMDPIPEDYRDPKYWPTRPPITPEELQS